jgi:hypothetical protein
MDANPHLYNKLEINERHLPQLFLINNTSMPGQQSQYDKLDEKNLKKYLKSRSEINWSINDEDPLDEIDADHIDESLKSTSDNRLKFAKIIRIFLRHNEMLSSGEVRQLDNDMNAAKDHNKNVKINEVKNKLKK